MNRITYIILSLFFLLPLSISAQEQEEITIIENEESQTITGTLITISDTEEYITTDLKLYQVTNKNLALLGDLVKDMVINVNDITAMVDMILSNAFSAVADVNENGSVDVNDITGEVDVALGRATAKEYVESYIVNDITDVWVKSSTATAVDQH